ncbi:MAG: T9SS type A sorting domain-containing protein [Bacteroidia bacterium]
MLTNSINRLFCIFLIAFTSSMMAQPASFSSRGIGGGGALFSLSINPANNSEYYVSCDMGELFHTTDFGVTYNQVNFQELVGGHNSKVCFTSTPGLLYSVSYANNEIVPMKSTDDGITWNPLPGNPDNTEETFTIDADYNNPSRVIISYYGDIYFSSNGGTTFTNIHTAATGSGNVVGGVFFDGANIYIGTNDGVIVSTTSGASWSVVPVAGLPASERIWSFAGARSGSTTRFFCITADVADIYVGVVGSDYYGFPKGVYSVDYGAGSWTPKMTGITAGTDFPMFVKMATSDITTLYLAGSDDVSEPIVLKTTNAGSGWTHVFNTANNLNINTGWSGQGGDRGWSYGECPFGLAVAPNNVNDVIFGDFGFVHKTSNGGTTWQQAYLNPAGQHPVNTLTPVGASYSSAGIENTTCWQVHWLDANNMWSCFSDIRGIRSTDAGNSWSFNYTGNSANSTYRVVQHPTTGTLFAGTSNIHDMYQSTRLADAQLDAADGNGKIIYSTNGGLTWINLHVFNHPVFWIALDPTNSNVAYASVIHYNGGAGVGGIYRTTNLNLLAGSTWTLLPNPPRTEKHPASIVVLNDGKVVCTYSGRRTTAFQPSSGTFVYDPVGGSWTDVSDAGMYYWTKDIVVDPNDATQNTWYVCVFSGWGGPPNGLGGLYKTTNRGTSWTKLTGTTLDRVTSVTFNPNDANQVFLTTEGQGLWMSGNINSGTPTFSMVSNYPFQQPERVFFNPYNTSEMWVTSFGNGMKMGTMLSTGVAEFTEATGLLAFPNPATGQVKIMNAEGKKISVYSSIGQLVYEQAIEQNEITLDLSAFENGVYFVSCGTKKTKIILAK